MAKKSSFLKKDPMKAATEVMVHAVLGIAGGTAAEVVESKLFKTEKMPAFIQDYGSSLTLATGLATDIFMENKYVGAFAKGMQIVSGTNLVKKVIGGSLGLKPEALSGVEADGYDDAEMNSIVNRALAGINIDDVMATTTVPVPTFAPSVPAPLYDNELEVKPSIL